MDADVYIGIGSNMGDRKAHIDKALRLLREVKELELKTISQLYENEAVGGPAEQDKFLNGAVHIRTSLNPLELLNKLKYIEYRLGRPKKREKNAPRQIDLDILIYSDVVVKGENIHIPHPRMAQRHFVLKPLSEIAPDILHPELKKTASRLLEELENGSLPLDK